MDSGNGGIDYTPLMNLATMQPGAPHGAPVPAGDSGAGGVGGLTCIPPVSFRRDESAPPTMAYAAPTPFPPGGPLVGGRMYPTDTRLSGGGAMPGAVAATQPYGGAAAGGLHLQPYQPTPGADRAPAFGGGHPTQPNPRLDPAGSVYTHLPDTPASFDRADARRAFMNNQAELKELHESRMRSAQYTRLFQSGLFPALAALLFLLFVSAPATDATLRVFAPLGLVHESGGGFTLAGSVLRAALFGFAFSFAVYLA
jgi:hypothetical protein